MIYSNWMSYIKDDVKITKLVIPGSHNAGSYGMNAMACCQDDNLYLQILYGIRQFCLRLDTDKKGRIHLAHGITKGDLFENALKDIRRALDENPSEIFFLDIREYYPQNFGPVTLRYSADPKQVDALLEKYLEPEKYAYHDFDKISEVTLGDIRKAGKRYILINENEDYKYSRSCDQIFPWDKTRNGMKAKNYAAVALKFFDEEKTDGLYWFQTQQTPNPGTEVGLTTPRKLDLDMRKYFPDLMNRIEENAFYLESANIIAGDFMTLDFMKSKTILRLNLAKDNVIADKEKEYGELLA